MATRERGGAMLIIRKAQMDALDASTGEAFRKCMLRHVIADFPARAAELGAENTRRVVETMIAKGLDYGIVSEDDLQAYLDVAVELGPEFEELPEMDWAKEI